MTAVTVNYLICTLSAYQLGGRGSPAIEMMRNNPVMQHLQSLASSTVESRLVRVDSLTGFNETEMLPDY